MEMICSFSLPSARGRGESCWDDRPGQRQTPVSLSRERSSPERVLTTNYMRTVAAGCFYSFGATLRVCHSLSASLSRERERAECVHHSEFFPLRPYAS
jgi:hypothetical protein